MLVKSDVNNIKVYYDCASFANFFPYMENICASITWVMLFLFFTISLF